MKTRPVKILFIFPNIQMHVLPLAIARFSALLKKEGHVVELFEADYQSHPMPDSGNVNGKQNPLLKVESPVIRNSKNIFADLNKKTESFCPDLVAIAISEISFSFCIQLLDSIKNREIPAIAGGPFPTFGPEKVIACDSVDIICIGEGENALVELCRRMSKGLDYNNIPNLWIKQKNGEIIRNPIGPLIDLEQLPVPDFSIFRHTRYYPPHGLIPIETQRGCPHQCGYCNSGAQNALYKANFNTLYYRKRSISSIKHELENLIKTIIPGYIYFISDTFLHMTDREFDEFIEVYSDYKIPFIFTTRPETITSFRIEKLKAIGMDGLSIGLEHGNEEFRKKVIKRYVSNEKIIKAFHIANDAGVKTAVDNIIGFPNETRELAFDTIRLNRSFSADIRSCFIFVPYHGTALRKLAEELGYLKTDTICGCLYQDSLLDMPRFTRKQINALKKSFQLYITYPESCWPDIEKAEFEYADNQQDARNLPFSS